MLAKSGELQPSKVEAKPSDCKVEGIPSSENDSTSDYFKDIKTHVEAFPSLTKSKCLTILLTLMESSGSNEKGYVRSIHDAVEAINELYPSTQPRSCRPSAFLWTFWDSLLIVAKRIPYNDDPKQNLLVDFLTNLHQKTIGTVFIRKVCVSYYFLTTHRIMPRYLLSTF
jgi:hypothetical protein